MDPARGPTSSASTAFAIRSSSQAIWSAVGRGVRSRQGWRSLKHWTDADKDGCNTRAEVLLEEAVTAPEVGPKCALNGGNWYSPYDDRYLDSASKLDVDHLLSAPGTDLSG
ncbi:hypothetical protein [Streptomyces sp. NPDC056683]|uniref:hypothetical protein n=1 Tax=Streptomyces sp. NPDC056683 TaxID=3345910 RepID=UPI003684C1CF